MGPVDRELSAPLPAGCPDYGAAVCLEREEEQFQAELPERRPIITRVVIGIGRCTKCRSRVQRPHPEQTSDALGAAAFQVGPTAMGLSFHKTAAKHWHLGVPVTAGALSSGAAAGPAGRLPNGSGRQGLGKVAAPAL